MKLRVLILLTIFTAAFFALPAQETFPINGIHDSRPETFAFTNATIYVDYKTVITNGTLLIEKGKVKAVGVNVAIPENVVRYDLSGRYIYPSFIDLHSNYGMPEAKKSDKSRADGPQMESDKKGAFGWNQAIQPEINANEIFAANDKQADEMRKLGFGAVLTHQQDGIARGSGALVSLANGKENEIILRENATAHYSFDKGTSTQDYPGSLMGAVALLRQSYLDAAWYKNSSDNKENNISLHAWNQLQNVPQVFEVNDLLSIFRADKIGDEFGVQYIIKGAGTEYQRLQEISETRAALIVPVNFPEAYDVENPFDALNVSLAEMKHWEMAPANLSFLEKAGVNFSITSSGLKEKKDFSVNIRKAIQHGLSKDAALKSLTLNPAKMLGAENLLGSLEPGKSAGFLITTGDIFEEETKILENWIQGKKYSVNDVDLDSINGNYELNYDSKTYKLVIEGSPFKTKVKLFLTDTAGVDVTFSKKNNLVSLSFKPDSISGSIRLSGLMEGNIWSGKGQLGNGKWTEWKAVYKNPVEKKSEEKKQDKPAPVIGKVIFPFIAYGYEETPKAETVLLKNAIVWTNEKEGILQNADVLVKNGKIAAVGKSLTDATAKVIDATGKHVTAGIIDEHSHIAISRGVNEWTQASSAEVRIGDVVNSEDVNIYRQLAGGVTAAQLLHGSANPIGGQSAIIKLRWGFSPEKMKLENAPGFIKFALGENVKQANWGERNTVRYPQTRMGVEQVYVNYFTRAKEYELAADRFNALSAKDKTKSSAPRKDLESEALLEILNKKRFITCHSYVQSEINMLMKVAESFSFRVNTFTHILEGYKVADKMKAHGVHASSFADWWAYKYEVIDAIPYNAAILTQVGVCTAINSDDAEMGRRLNQEAAKGIKYGGMSQEEAWKMVTLNPAKMLQIDNRTGSIKAGKDADVVVWSENPLSIYAKVEKTFVDGICFFDAEQDVKMRAAIEEERARLIQKMLEAKKGGAKTQAPVKKEQRLYHCEDIEP